MMNNVDINKLKQNDLDCFINRNKIRGCDKIKPRKSLFFENRELFRRNFGIELNMRGSAFRCKQT